MGGGELLRPDPTKVLLPHEQPPQPCPHRGERLSSDRPRSALAPNATWEHHREFVRAVAKRAVEHLTDPQELNVQVADLPRYLQGIDYHFYHVESGNRQHIAFLPLEVDELRRAVWGGVAEAVPDLEDEYVETSDWFYQTFPISVMETGTSASARNTAVQFPVFVGREIDHETFQEHEVWRRLGGALASSADVAGWHAWLSGSEPNVIWYGFGLRGDTAVPADPYTDALNARPRQSWGAFQRLADYLVPVHEVAPRHS